MGADLGALFDDADRRSRPVSAASCFRRIAAARPGGPAADDHHVVAHRLAFHSAYSPQGSGVALRMIYRRAAALRKARRFEKPAAPVASRLTTPVGSQAGGTATIHFARCALFRRRILRDQIARRCSPGRWRPAPTRRSSIRRRSLPGSGSAPPRPSRRFWPSAGPPAGLAEAPAPPLKPDGSQGAARRSADSPPSPARPAPGSWRPRRETLGELIEALAAFDGCALKKTATNLVFADGNPEARIMFVGEAPGADEDRAGKPFVGSSGQLLDRMLAWIGLDRSRFYITNIVFWRPPGNRTPTSDEVAACLPFVIRHIELVAPAILVSVGGPATETLLRRGDGISKLHGRWFDYQSPGLERPVPTFPIFHPAFLLRAPAQKRAAWRDLLVLEQKLGEIAEAQDIVAMDLAAYYILVRPMAKFWVARPRLVL